MSQFSFGTTNGPISFGNQPDVSSDEDDGMDEEPRFNNDPDADERRDKKGKRKVEDITWLGYVTKQERQELEKERPVPNGYVRVEHEKMQADKWEQFRAKDPSKVGFTFPTQTAAATKGGPNYKGDMQPSNAPIFGGVANNASNSNPNNFQPLFQ